MAENVTNGDATATPNGNGDDICQMLSPCAKRLRLSLDASNGRPFIDEAHEAAFQRAGPVVQRELGRAWTAFEAADPATQQLLLDGILARCSMAQRSYACELLRKVMYVDFIAALPPELALRILLHLDALSLCRASQVSRTWHRLADHDRIWQRMCHQHIGHRCKNCGWGLPSLSLPATLPDAVTQSALPAKVIYGQKYRVARNWKQKRYVRRALVGHTDWVLCLQADSDKIVSGSLDSTIRVWDIHTLTCRMVLQGHQGPVRCLQFDGSTIVSGSRDATVRIWSLQTGELVKTFRGHASGVVCLNLNNEGRMVTGAEDGEVMVWSRTDRRCVPLRGHTAAVTSVRLVGASQVLSASEDMTIRLWDVDTGVGRIFTDPAVNHTDQITCLQLSTKVVMSSSLDRTLMLWERATGKHLATMFGHLEGVWCVKFDTLHIVSGSQDGRIIVREWDETNALTLDPHTMSQFVIDAHTDFAVTCIDLTESRIISGSNDGNIHIFDFGADAQP